jgi:hypothetical protein
LTSNDELVIEMTTNGDILFVKRDEVAVIRRGLDSVESGMGQANWRRPSPIRRKRSSRETVSTLWSRSNGTC